jgi:hypothetical protein
MTTKGDFTIVEKLSPTVTNYKGARIAHVFKGRPITTTATVDKQFKLEYNGPVCLDFLSNSYKYGSEVHLVTYQKDEPKFLARVAESRDWIRVETHFKPEVFTELAKAWLSYLGYEVTEKC